ncbi:regulator component [Streptomyces sp. Go40/10]|uniref:MAB_1171c family putative transporter n=1 Tax=Streptomyces sp. Go40/10 TaxID=2825844 RepID=UPI001E4B5C13|nr:MAB_1171c family putative transporter [Streptomyces sp. Go40/10]UFR01866.1 regulator component [Streptomyces sp. Go40/10]
MSELAAHVGLASVLVLWFALVWRARPALRQPSLRGLWLTVLAATTAITLFQPQVVAWLTSAGVDVHTVSLVRNLIGVLSAGLVLLFVIDSSRTPRLRLLVAVGMTAALASLLVLDLLQVDHGGAGAAAAQRPASASSAYWLILIAAHLAGDAVAVVVCWGYSLRTTERDLVWSLRLFAAGSVLALVFWSGYLFHLYDPAPRLLPYLSVVMGVHGFLRAASLLVPSATALARSATALRTTWRLWPLWRDLVTAVPHVALARPRRTRLQEVLWPRYPPTLLAHRQTIETYDALLTLQQYVQPDAYERAHRLARQAGVRDDRLACAALAGVVGQARRAVLVGVPPSSVSHPLPGVTHGSSETLLGIARMWPSMTNLLPCRERSASAQ